MLQSRVSLCCLLLLWPFTIENRNHHSLSCCEFLQGSHPTAFFPFYCSSTFLLLCYTSSLAKMS